MMNESPVAQPAMAPPAESRASTSRRLIVGAILIALLLGAVAVARSRARTASDTAATARAVTDRVIPVLTARAVVREMPIWLEGLGNVTAYYTVTVRTLVDGRIDQVFFTEGQHVKKGDPLLLIDPRPFTIALESAQAALERDQAQLKNAKLNADRYKTLTAQNLIATQQYTDQQAMADQLAGQVAADQAQIGSAKLNLEYAHITSPIEGVAGIRLVDPGNVVHPTDATGLVVVTQLDPIAVIFTLPEDDLDAVQTAMGQGDVAVEARSRDGNALLGTGKLAVIDNEINQSTATIRLKAIFENGKHLLWPNQFVKARAKVSTLHGATLVPLASIQHGPQGTFVYVVAPDKTAQMRPATVSTTQGDIAVVSKGVGPGDEVVVEGQAQLRPGSKVATKPATDPASSASGASVTNGPLAAP